MHEKRFDGEPDRLRSAARVALLEVEKVVNIVLDGIEASSMVDVGTGSGLFLEIFQKQGLRTAGLDVSPKMLELARQHLPDTDLRTGIAEALPFPDGFCDVVFMGLVLHETDAPLQALKEARRVGRVRTAALEWRYIADQEFGPPLEHRLSEEDIQKWGEQAGFVRLGSHALQHLVLYILDVK